VIRRTSSELKRTLIMLPFASLFGSLGRPILFFGLFLPAVLAEMLTI
jgi:hypothetical protein